jgi:hypothetical protein
VIFLASKDNTEKYFRLGYQVELRKEWATTPFYPTLLSLGTTEEHTVKEAVKLLDAHERNDVE